MNAFVGGLAHCSVATIGHRERESPHRSSEGSNVCDSLGSTSHMHAPDVLKNLYSLVPLTAFLLMNLRADYDSNAIYVGEHYTASQLMSKSRPQLMNNEHH